MTISLQVTLPRIVHYCNRSLVWAPVFYRAVLRAVPCTCVQDMPSVARYSGT
jgi:hypothetical protein